MKVKTEELRTAFKITDFVPVNAALESSQFVRLKNDGAKLMLSMAGSVWANINVTVSVVGGKWTAFVERRLLKAFLNSASEDEIEFLFKDKLTLKSDQRLEVALANQITGYDTWAPKNTFDLTDEQLRVIKTTTKYIPFMAGTEHVEAVYLGTDAFIVTDTIAIMAVFGCGIKSEMFLPPEIARYLSGAQAKLANDKNGAGVVLSDGVLYQTHSARIKEYPVDKTRSVIDQGVKAPMLRILSASSFLETLRVASQFLLDKTSEAVTVTHKGDQIIITADSGTNKFQRQIKVVKGDQAFDTFNLPAKKLIPWLEYIGEESIEFSRQPGVTILRCTVNKLQNVFMVADC